MGGLTAYMSALSMNIAQYNVQSQASISILKNAMDTDTAASAKLMESLPEMVPSADGHGTLLDVRA